MEKHLEGWRGEDFRTEELSSSTGEETPGRDSGTLPAPLAALLGIDLLEVEATNEATPRLMTAADPT